MELLSVAVAAKLAHNLSRSGLPDAPVVAVKRRKAGTFRRLLAGVLTRRAVPTINQED